MTLAAVSGPGSSSSVGPVSVRPEDDMLVASQLMRNANVGCLVVLDSDGAAVGILSERDIVSRCVAGGKPAGDTLVADCMTKAVTSVPADIPLGDLARLMDERHIRHVPIIADGRVVDVVSNRQVLELQCQRDRRLRDMVVFAMAKLAESRDPETGGHLERVQYYAAALAKELKDRCRFPGHIDDGFIEMIRVASALHDIGKVSIPDCVLLKPGTLSGDEWEIMKSHALAGWNTLNRAIEQFHEADFLVMARDIAAHHHEHYDGTGYPEGLVGEQIPLAARIFAVADVYDALISKRVYKPACSHSVAKQYIFDSSGTHFDPEVVIAFGSCQWQFLAAKAGSGAADTEVPIGKAP